MDQFTDLFATGCAHEHFKQLIKQKHNELRDKFDPLRSVSDLLCEKSTFIDTVLSRCWRHFLGSHAKQLSLIAVGGYGRREMFPHSDIDILILTDTVHNETYRELLADFSRFLWDIGLKPGQSVRSVSECVQAAADDQTIMTTLLDARLIDGNPKLLEQLTTLTSTDNIWPSEQFFHAKFMEQRARYAKFYDTAYNLEPNIKEGPGGLRDIQIITWIFKRHYHTQTLQELIKYDFLSESEYAELVNAQQTLWRLRYALHTLTDRGEDRLLFDYQHDLAERFGFAKNNATQNVEQFMQFYFKTVVGLERLNEILLQLFDERFIKRSNANHAAPINAKFNSVGRYIEAASDKVFELHPTALLEIFLVLQQSPSLLGIRATTIRLIRKNLYLIDDAFRHNKSACRLFIDILRQPRGVLHQLRRMNRYGILAAYLPSFQHIVARMQYDLFHIYTVDEHTLFVIRNLRRFSLRIHRTELPLCSDIFLLIKKPHLLYIAALFHDIAKGKGGDHSELGETIARDFCMQHDIPEYDTKLTTWLVRNHLLMSMTAQRKDISDPGVIYEFASKIGTIERLNHLYLLTVADIRATNPELWNSWKDALLKELYTATHRALHQGLQNPIDQAARIAETKQEAARELQKLGITQAQINSAWRHISDDYLLRFSPDEIIWHTIAIAANNNSEQPLVLLRPQTLLRSAEVFVFSPYKDTVFSLITGALDQLGFTILDARITTTKDNYLLHSFQILEQSGYPINDLFREIHICAALRKVLQLGRSGGQKNIRHRASRQAKHFPIPTTFFFHPATPNRYTPLEIICTDRPGLLSKIGKAFLRREIILHNAKITTIGSRVEDMFYITDKRGNPIEHPETRQQLRDEIIKVLNGTTQH
ncbi:MAG: [protein-PII] uridylyltransferase [Gammaproteobacteria bacterium]